MKDRRSVGFKSKSGHGSITKAGKVRGQTPKVKPMDRSTHGPRLTNRRKYYLMKLTERLDVGRRLEYRHRK